MTRRKEEPNPGSQLDRDLAELKLLEIAKAYREVLDEAARKGSSVLEILQTLIGLEVNGPSRTRPGAPAERRQASQTQDFGRLRFRFPQTHPQGRDRAALRW